MVFTTRRRRILRQRRSKFLLALLCFILIWLFIREPFLFKWFNNESSRPGRLYCLILANDPKYEDFLSFRNQTWLTHCSTLEIVEHRARLSGDVVDHPIEYSYFWSLWNRISDALHQSISAFSWISKQDALLIIPAASYVFPKRLSLVWNELGIDADEPAIIIQESENLQAYIFNGIALREIYQNNLLGMCLEKTENSLFENDLWRCIKNGFRRNYNQVGCPEDQCFVYYQNPSLTISHIRNGTCLKEAFRECQSIALLYPITFEELITLEFFKYRLKPKPKQKSV